MKGVLIFNADDYGLSSGVSKGIFQAARGVVRSTSVMANMASAHDLVMLRDGLLSAGVHLNLSCGNPLTPEYPPKLLDGGNFNKSLALQPRTWQDVENQQAALAEWRAQLVACQQAGLRLTHIDSHHNTHLLDPLFDLALHLALDQDLALRTQGILRERAHQAGVRTPDVFIDGFYGDNNIDRANLLALLKAAPGGVVEVMCHPGQADESLSTRTSYCLERERELEVLGDEGLAAVLEDAGWKLGGYDLV